MTRRAPKLLDQETARRLMQRDGWTETRGGKHVVKMVKPGHRPVTLPHHHGEPYGKSLSARIIKQAALTLAKESPFASRSSLTRTGPVTGQRLLSSRDASRQAER